MPAFNQLMANFLSATNENNAALASVKFDFSLLRVDAPAEWTSVGKALSLRRRMDAEIGPVHRTARRLAALFEEVVPSTPKLVAAYGTRVSEIIAEPGINPTGSSSDGPFEAFVGAEGTAMWAAATSGISAIAIYLLACFLARAWDSRRSTSIWVELVEGRRSQIKLAVQRNEKVSEATLMSTLQEFTRQDLAIWDSSARSWLRSADQVKQWHLTQLHLVTKDVGLQFNEGVTTYAKVMGSWTKAMTGLESFLSGMPQQITDASVLLAFSAWHLFPDLIALSGQTVKVPFRDQLLPHNAIGTIGVYPATDPLAGGIQWSLTLSHLQYYGEPVHAVSQESQPRVTFSQLRLVVLGSLFSKWRTNRRDFLAAASFLTTLWKVLSRNSEKPAGISMARHFGWLHMFVQASAEFLEAYESSKSLYENCRRLIGFGYRRGSEFLKPGENRFVPYFGLCSPHVLSALKEKTDADFGIAYMESIVKVNNLSDRCGFILRAHLDDCDNIDMSPRFYEILALGNHRTSSNKRNCDGKPVVQASRPCWLHVSSQTLPDSDGRTDSIVRERQGILSAKGYTVLPIQTDGPTTDSRYHRSGWFWKQAPRFFSKQTYHQSDDSVNDGGEACAEQDCNCFRAGQDTSFKNVLGDWRCGLYLTGSATLKPELEEHVDIRAAECEISKMAFPGTLWSYMAVLTKESWHDCSDKIASLWDGLSAANVCVYRASKRSHFSLETCRVLQILAVTSQVFEKISRPTISLDCISLSIHKLCWRPQITPCGSLQAKCIDQNEKTLSVYSRMHTPIPDNLDRATAFSCVTFFDSGNLNLRPEDLDKVFAMSCESSLYVSAVVLSDPFDRAPAHEIRHIVGNIGRKGISMLVAPRRPRIRELSSDYRLINHEPYDYKREDNFGGTTLHLEFTEWTQALIGEDDLRTVDQEVFFVEAVISVRDKGVWVADLDILRINLSEVTMFAPVTCLNEAHSRDNKRLGGDDQCDYTSIDNWDELLDNPTSIGIIRAHDNWAARLAATSILFQTDLGYCIGLFGSGEMCLHCTSQDMLRGVGELGLQKFEGTLPQFCID